MAKAKSTKTAKTTTAKSKSAATTVRRKTTANTSLVKRLVTSELRLGALFAELIGVFVLTVAVLNTGGNVIVAALAVLVLVLALSKLSGGHVNPVVTLSLLATRQMSPWRAVGYLVAQTLGAMLALIVVTQFVLSGTTQLGAEVFKVQELTGDWKPFFAEALGGLVFGFGVAAAFLGRKEGYDAAFTIGGALLLALLVATLGSAAIVNPAVALGLSAYTGNLWSVAAYALGPVVGGIAGAWLYKLLQRDVENA
ncbi:MAG: aquaporin [Candidatus Saccharimonadales bacterium]